MKYLHVEASIRMKMDGNPSFSPLSLLENPQNVMDDNHHYIKASTTQETRTRPGFLTLLNGWQFVEKH